MAITLADVRKLEKDALTAGFMDTFLLRNKMSQFIPIKNVTTMRARILRRVAMPTISWRQLGTYYSQSTGSVDFIEEPIYDCGNYFDVDELLMKDTSVQENPRTVQQDLTSEAMSFEYNNILINGASGSDQPDGLSARVAALASAQSIDTGSTDISMTGSTTTSLNSYFDYLDQLLYQIDDGTDFANVLLLGNTDLMQRHWSAARRLGLLDTTKDMFGREIRTYKGAKLLDIGVKADQTTKIVTTSSNLTTLYAVKVGEGFLQQLQYEKLNVKDLGQQPGTRALRTQVNWAYGFTQPHPRGIARLQNLKVS